MNVRVEYIIIAACLLDLLVGRPRRAPQFRNLVAWYAGLLENFLRKLFRRERWAGTVCVWLALPTVLCLSYGVLHAAWLVDESRIVYWIVSVLTIYWCLRGHDLLKQCRQVFSALAAEDVKTAGKRLGRFVGRDLDGVNADGIVRVAVQHLGENIVDGIIAPLFYAMLLGPIGAVLCRTIDVLDAEFGYLNKRYKEFGKAVAQLNDQVHFIPSRLATPLICLAATLLFRAGKRSFLVFLRDGLKHTSPNAGPIVAAMAGALGIQLGGPRSYGGRILMTPRIGEEFEAAEPKHIMRAGRLVLITLALFLGLGLVIRYGLVLWTLHIAES